MKNNNSLQELRERFEHDIALKVKLLDVTADSVIVHNSAGEIIYVNNAGCRMRGYSREEILKLRMVDLIAPGYLDFAKQQIETIWAKGFAEFEITHRRKDGSVFVVEVHSSILNVGEEKLAMGFARDITERKKMETELRESEERFRNFALMSPVGIYLSDYQGHYQYVNKRWCEIAGLSPLEASGDGWLKGLHPDDCERIRAGWSQFVKTGGKWVAEYRFRSPEGKVTWVYGTVAPLHDDQGKVNGFLGTNSDITELKRTEDSLRIHDAIFRNLAEGIYLIGWDDLIIKWTNRKFEEMFGYDPGEMIGKKVDIVNDPAEKKPEETRKAIVDIIKETGEWHGEVKNIKKDGTPFWCYSNVSLFDHSEYKKIMISAHTDITERKQAEERLKESFLKLQKILEGTINALAVTTENRDPYTAGHQRRVADLSFHIGREMGLSEEQVQGLKFAGLIHDIGKISIPLEILNKPGRLSEAEFTLIKGHSQVGYDILKDIDFGWPIAQIVLQHHERINGSGYPGNIGNGDILLESKIIGVADVVEAMASDRPYRPALGVDAALEELNQKKGQLYDSQIVDICNKLFKEKGYKFD